LTQKTTSRHEKIGDFEVDQFHKGIVHHDGKDISESLL
jgi:hypothetical protein